MKPSLQGALLLPASLLFTSLHLLLLGWLAPSIPLLLLTLYSEQSGTTTGLLAGSCLLVLAMLALHQRHLLGNWLKRPQPAAGWRHVLARLQSTQFMLVGGLLMVLLLMGWGLLLQEALRSAEARTSLPLTPISHASLSLALCALWPQAAWLRTRRAMLVLAILTLAALLIGQQQGWLLEYNDWLKRGMPSRSVGF